MDHTVHADQNQTLVPAVCTQCGAHLEVDPSKDAAVCQYCGTPFIVQKAISEYNIQHATIEHVDTVRVEMKSKTESFLDFMGKQLSESRQVRKEERQVEKEFSHRITMLFIKVFGGIMVLFLIVGLIGMMFGLFRGDGAEEVTSEVEGGPAYTETVDGTETAAGEG